MSSWGADERRINASFANTPEPHTRRSSGGHCSLLARDTIPRELSEHLAGPNRFYEEGPAVS